MLSNETERINDRRKYRNTRRNRLRYRKPRFNNRMSKMTKGESLAPSVQHRMDNQIRLFNSYCKVMPVTQTCFETGKFDTQLLQAIAEGKPIPEGKDYQRGSKYLYQTERKAVFGRDCYTCQCCGRSIKDGAILHTHHIGFWMTPAYRSNRIGNLLTVCEKCHTAKNHNPGGKLWGIKPKSDNFSGTAFMNSVRWRMVGILKESHPDIDIRTSDGARTSLVRTERHIEKTHTNDAYCIGDFRPKHRCRQKTYVKKRQNNRILSKFYDAKFIDIRDGIKKSGSQLSCGRTDRSESRHSEKNERIFRGKKCSTGKCITRRQHYTYQPCDTVLWKSRKYSVKGTHCNGTRVLLTTGKSVKISDLQTVRKAGEWQFIPD